MAARSTIPEKEKNQKKQVRLTKEGKPDKRIGNKAGGRPKGSRNKTTIEIRQAAQKYSDDALKALFTVVTKSNSDTAKISAAREILDRAYGRSPQALTGADGGAMEMVARIERVFVDGPED